MDIKILLKASKDVSGTELESLRLTQEGNSTTESRLYLVSERAQYIHRTPTSAEKMAEAPLALMSPTGKSF